MIFRLKYDKEGTKVDVASSDPILVSAVYNALRKSVGQYSRIELREEGGILGGGHMNYDTLCGYVGNRMRENTKGSCARRRKEDLIG